MVVEEDSNFTINLVSWLKETFKICDFCNFELRMLYTVT